MACRIENYLQMWAVEQIYSSLLLVANIVAQARRNNFIVQLLLTACLSMVSAWV